MAGWRGGFFLSQLQIHSGSSVIQPVIQRRASVNLQFPSSEALSHPAVTAVTALTQHKHMDSHSHNTQQAVCTFKAA